MVSKLLSCNHILWSSQPVFRVGLPPRVCTCSTPAWGTTLPPQQPAADHCVGSPFTARRKQCCLFVCVCVCRCNDKAAAAVAGSVTLRKTQMMNCKCREMVKVRGRIPRARRCGVRWWGLGEVRTTLWCASSFKIRALCLKAPLWLTRWGEGREAVICRHSYGNVLTALGLAGQRVRRWLFGL